jgi:hypothetical protein
MFYRRSTYERFGGFDDTARHRLKFRVNERARGTGFGEDSIFAWNLIRAGVAHAHAPEAIVEHQVFPPDPIEWFSRALQMAAFPALVKEVPELRRTLLRNGFYLRTRNRVPVYVTLLLTLLGGRRLAMAGVAWWVLATALLLRRIPGRWPRNLPWLPAEMALDAVVSGSLLVGSARARSLVL